ncbi:MAG TPA: amidase [Bryobacteraceae bacterium]|nr:amidase [Bryobacteraceae bacterium]
MDRRTLLQLLSILGTVRPGHAQQEPRQQPPLRVTKEQVAGALTLLGLDFTAAEIDMMLPRVNNGLDGYASLRKIEVPYGVEPAFTFHPGLPERVPAKGAPRFKTTFAHARKAKAPADLEEVAFWRVSELAPLVRSRAISATDLARMYLERMKKHGPKLLALVTLTEELALEQAAAADAEIRRGRYRGPLHGIPFGAKDLFDTKGIPTTWGAEPFQNRVPHADATCIERLYKAGAVLVAKLSMGALAQGDLWYEGRTKSPWPTAAGRERREYDRGSSGSSAGPAAATAAGLVGFSLGTETLGSIVSPSMACGTVGLRPTYGRISRRGAMALSWTMDKVGPICRGVEDCALVLHAIYGPDGHDRSVAADAFHWEPQKPLKSLRVAILQKAFDRAAGEQKKVRDQAIEDLKSAGVSMTPVEYNEDLGVIRFLLEAEAAAAFDDVTRDGQIRTLRGQSPGDWPNSFRGSRLIPAVEYIRAQRLRQLMVERFEKFMAGWDVVVIPPTALLTTTNLTGNPQVVMKCGFVNGLPQSISFLGGIYDEGSPLRVALAYEQATGWHKQNPSLLS